MLRIAFCSKNIITIMLMIVMLSPNASRIIYSPQKTSRKLAMSPIKA